MAQKFIQLQLTKRGLVRAVSFLCAGVVTLSAGAVTGAVRAERYRVMLEDSYSASLTGLSSSLSGISAALQKGRYASSSVQLSYLAASLWKDAASAKTSLGNLPVGELRLERTNEFLSQVGDYAMALSRKSVSGAEISRRERDDFSQLCRYGLALADQINLLERDVTQNAVTMERVRTEIEQMNTAGAQPQGTRVSTVNADAFRALEEAFSGYPDFVYDGPFSTHIAKRSPVLLQKATETAVPTATASAARAAEVELSMLTLTGEENSPLNCYTFSGDGVWVGITRRGGEIAYLMRSRVPLTQELEPRTALANARRYLAQCGYEGLEPTYYEISDAVMTASFAAMQGEVVLYPDLIKVDIAMDNGELLGLDARGYLYNHTQRPLIAPALTAQDAIAGMSKALTAERTRLAVIPTAGQGEVFCWEVASISEKNERVLVYVNANSGVEEQILMLAPDGAGAALL